MNADSPVPVYSEAAHAPWREILRHRFSGRRDRALVLRDTSGALHVLAARRGNRTGADAVLDTYGDGAALARETGPAPGLLGGYEAAFHVLLGEHPATRAVGLWGANGPESVLVRVRWWVHDPRQVVATRTAYGWDVVCKDLDNCLRALENSYAKAGQTLGAEDVQRHLSEPRRLDGYGLTYRVSEVRPRDGDGELRLSQAGGGDVPFVWTAARREEYDFCLQAVRSGPSSLAAMWLLRHPDQVADVLDWAVGHQKLLREETNWQDAMASMLGSLTEQEKLEISELLRDRLASLGRGVPTGGGSDGAAPGGPGRPADGARRRPV